MRFGKKHMHEPTNMKTITMLNPSAFLNLDWIQKKTLFQPDQAYAASSVISGPFTNRYMYRFSETILIKLSPSNSSAELLIVTWQFVYTLHVIYHDTNGLMHLGQQGFVSAVNEDK